MTFDLWNVVTAAERAQRFVQGKTFADYQEDEMLRSAAERQLETVGEALAQLRRIDPVCAGSIAELPQDGTRVFQLCALTTRTQTRTLNQL